MKDGAAVLVARGLSRRFGHRVALADLDLSLPAGSGLALFGSNGAGKTTLLRILATTLRPSGGTLSLEGLDPRRQGPAVRGRLGALYHHTLLYDALTATENVLLAARLHGLPDAEPAVDSLLDGLGLGGFKDEPVRVLSRGLRQRVALARAMIHGPRLLLLDEPFTGLDLQSAGLLKQRIAQLREGGTVVVLATHNFARGLECADRFLVLNRGRRTADGPTAGVDPREFERRFLRGTSPSPTGDQADG